MTYISVILPCILKTIWCTDIIIWDYESVWPDIWPKNKCMSLCLYFIMVQWFCVIYWRLFDVWTSYFGIMGQHNRQTFDLKINIYHCDLYFMDWCLKDYLMDECQKPYKKSAFSCLRNIFRLQFFFSLSEFLGVGRGENLLINKNLLWPNKAWSRYIMSWNFIHIIWALCYNL